MNKLKTVRRLKMFGSILGAYVFVTLSTPHIFMANSSQFKPEFIAWMRSSPQIVYAMVRYPLDSEARDNAVQTAQIGNNTDKENLPFQSVAPGVYAAEDPETKERYVKVEKGTTIEVRYITLSDGRKVKVYIPVSQ